VDTFVFVDEHPDSINDGAFYAPQSKSQFVDVPATYHNKACGFSFADGHAEIHKWQGVLRGSQYAQVRARSMVIHLSSPAFPACLIRIFGGFHITRRAQQALPAHLSKAKSHAE
jgi:prepilin-type processing-associated H-X9-DG protein